MLKVFLDPGKDEHILLNYFSSRALRRLILASSEIAEHTGGNTFPLLLWQKAFKGRCEQWLGTHAEKILAALATCPNTEVTSALDAELRPTLKKSVLQWAAEFVQHGSETSKLPSRKKSKKQGKLTNDTTM